MKKIFSALLGTSVLFSLCYGDVLIDDALLQRAEKKYNIFAKNRFQALSEDLLHSLKDANEQKKLNTVNTWFNEIKYKSDEALYHQSDYWATLYEFVGNGAGDCEDYTIAKYYTLKALGVDPNKLKFTYVVYRDKEGKNIPHMVLSYLKVPNPKTKDDILILDNINRLVLPASKRPDIIKVIKMINGDTGPKSKKWQQLELDMQRRKL